MCPVPIELQGVLSNTSSCVPDFEFAFICANSGPKGLIRAHLRNPGLPWIEALCRRNPACSRRRPLAFSLHSAWNRWDPLSPTNQSLPADHQLTINVTGILTGCTLELELVAVTVIVNVPAGVPGGGGGGVEPPPQPTQSSTANAPAAKTHRRMCLLACASRTITSRQIAHSGQARMLKLAGGSRSVGQGTSWARAVVVTVIVEELPEAGFGLKLAVAAAGNPATLKVKLSAKPTVREIVTV